LERISPTNDLLFRKVLASENHKDILGGLIGDFFGVEVAPEEITIENPYSIESYKEYIKDEEAIVLRSTIKDIAASFKSADFVSELQVRKTSFYDERSIYYPFEKFIKNYNKAGAMVVDSEGRPNRYSSLIPVYALNILGYTHFKNDDDALRVFELYDPKRNKRFNKNLVNIGFFELKKTNIETENQKHWRKYFISGETVADAPDYIKKASQIIEWVNLDEEEKRMVRALEKAQATYDAGMVTSYHEGKVEGRVEGKAEGRAEGKAEGKAEGRVEGAQNKAIEIARSLLDILDVDTIALKTKLTVEQVTALKTELAL